jgi:isopentenyl phosphate kinase
MAAEPEAAALVVKLGGAALTHKVRARGGKEAMETRRVSRG